MRRTPWEATLNYRHAYHAGNVADCMKHALLLALLDALHQKPGAVFVLDTHAGQGCYDLDSAEARATGESEAGIARLLADTPPALACYADLVRALGLYPGSPALLRARLRPQDRLACCELHPEDAALLRRLFRHDPQVAVHRRDGWEALGALLPPAETRALVLIDPPYERADEIAAVLEGLRTARRRFAAGVLAVWYPIKHRAPVRTLHAAVRESGPRRALAAELWLRAPLDPGRLNGCGLLVLNPPFGFAATARTLLAALLERLGTREAGEGCEVTVIADA
jgi:23S rRNA (adenine2030-N6)-methyltransferase